MQDKEKQEEEKKDEPVGHFKVDEEFLKELDRILFSHFRFHDERKKIIDEFIKLIKNRIVKK